MRCYGDCGSVVEPMPMQISSLGTFFEHYTAGCSVLESFISPWHRLCSSFFGGSVGASICSAGAGSFVGCIELSKNLFGSADASTQLRGVSWRYTFLLDGRVVDAESEMSSYRVNPVELADGYHTLKCVAWWIIRCGFMDLIQNRLS